MNQKLKIKISIGGRVYPLSVSGEAEEEGMRKAANKINALISQFEQNYAVSDKQDVLAMCALQFASQAEIHSITNNEDLEKATKKINAINDKLTALLQ